MKLLGIASLGILLVAAMGTGSVYAWPELAPLGVEVPALEGRASVDPRTLLTVKSFGVGSRLGAVELRDDSGRIIAQGTGSSPYTLPVHLDFGTHYTLKATAERPWLGQSKTRELAFSTVSIPLLEGPMRRELAPDGSLSLHFDRPVGKIEGTGNVEFEVKADESRQTFTLVAKSYPQGGTVPVELKWQTPGGIPLPPLHLQMVTPPALTAEIKNDGRKNLGLGMPVEIQFSEPLADRKSIREHVSVRGGGEEIPGKWLWYGQKRVQFRPDPVWPAFSTVEVTVKPGGLKSARGGLMEHPVTGGFETGPDKRIRVYLDKQRAEALENGQVVRTFKISSGKAKTPTVTGSFYIYARYLTKTMRSQAKPGEKGYYVVENVPYAQYFYSGYAFHGAFWHNGFGTPHSHGCVNLSTRKRNHRWPNAVEDAGWLYQWGALGVPVTVTNKAQAQVALQ